MEQNDAGAAPNEVETEDHRSFRFLTVSNPRELKAPHLQRSIRSHAVKRGIDTRRKKQEARGQNFRNTLPGAANSPSLRPGGDAWQYASPQTPPQCLSFGIPQLSLNHNDTDLSRLRELLSSNDAKRAFEPVFSVDDDVALQTFSSVFRENLDDPALLNAILLTATFAVAGGVLNQEGLRYQTQAMKSIRKRIDHSVDTVTTSTLGAMLLLAGVEMRLGMRPQVELHLHAVRTLLESSKKRNNNLTADIKRAIFWQDLYAHVFTESNRVVDHTTFGELSWQRDMFSPHSFVVPPGFQSRAYLFSPELMEVLKDINALTDLRDSPIFSHADASSVIQMDNQQAWIQSRLVDLPGLPFIQECCRLAAYLCASIHCCKVWRLSVMPARISSQLLERLQESSDDPAWDEEPELLAWLLYVGGAYSAVGPTRSGYAKLLRRGNAVKLRLLDSSWEDLVDVLRQFIWSEKVLALQVEVFWREARDMSV